MGDVSGIAGLVVAALGGAAIGLERQQSGHASGEKARFAGIRTFTLLGSVSGVAGWLAQSGHATLSLSLISGVLALIVVAYAAASRRDIDATTEVAAVVVVAAGALAGLGETRVASGIIALTVLLLVEKSELHKFAARIDSDELRAAARFAVMAVVILPLLPKGPYGPLGGFRPQELWLLVLFFSGLGFVGYLARRVLGAAHGYPLTGALAGIVSSTNATFSFARLSREERVPAGTLATGAIAASTVLFPRVLTATAVLDVQVARALLPYLAVPFAVGLLVVVLWLRAQPRVHPEKLTAASPLQVLPALQMAATFQAVLFVVALVYGAFGDRGLLTTGFLLGLTDVDALTISMTRSVAGGVSAHTAAQAIAAGILANCGLKAALAVFLGTYEFGKRTGSALAAMAAALAVALALP